MRGYPQLKTPEIEEDAQALRGWAFVLRAAAGIGGYRDVVFEDSRIHAGVVACGGWLVLCRSESVQHAVLCRRFVQGYRRAEHGEPRSGPAVLHGAHHPTGGSPVVLRRVSAWRENNPLHVCSAQMITNRQT